jgi:hypothetical protein
MFACHAWDSSGDEVRFWPSQRYLRSFCFPLVSYSRVCPVHTVIYRFLEKRALLCLWYMYEVVCIGFVVLGLLLRVVVCVLVRIE